MERCGSDFSLIPFQPALSKPMGELLTFLASLFGPYEND